jgi:hypothetical protein
MSIREMTYDEAVAYAKKLHFDTDVMVDNKEVYHVIDFHAVEHWKQHMRTVAEVRWHVEITEIK